MNKTVAGSCLCGQVSCSVTGPYLKFYQCHCDRCQKKTGSAFASLLFTTPDKIDWHSGAEKVKRFDLPNAERFSNSFCIDCGSGVPYLSRDGKFLVVPAGFLDNELEVVPEANIFWQERTCWYDQGQAADKFDRYPE